MPRRNPTNRKAEGRKTRGGDGLATRDGDGFCSPYVATDPGERVEGLVAAPGKPGLSIFWKLLLICVLPAVLTYGLFGFMAHYESRATLERELGRRLISIAQAAASTIRADEVMFLEPGDEESRVYSSLQRRLDKLRRASGMSRVFLVDKDLRAIVDTRKGGVIGAKFYHLDVQQSFLRKVLKRGYGSSLLYESGGKLYKSGFAVLRGEDGEALAFVVVEGRAEQYEALGALSRRLILLGSLAAVVLIILSALLARRIAVPLKKLERAAQLMARGTLDRPIEVKGGGEVAQVSSSMEKMRRELHRRDEQLRMMLAGVAHEVRNPLGGMELIVGMLREDLEGDPEKLESVDRIRHELDYLGKVVRDFLEYARCEFREAMVVNLADTVREGMELLAKEAEQYDVEMDSVGVPPETMAMCAREPVRRVILNLLKNAIHAAGERAKETAEQSALDSLEKIDEAAETTAGLNQNGTDGRRDVRGRVWVDASTRERGTVSFVELKVRDNGCGVDPELVEKIFEPFYTSKQQGTGLGLALGRKVAHAHGGYLYVESAGEDLTDEGAPVDGAVDGAVFVLGLPMAEGKSHDQESG